MSVTVRDLFEANRESLQLSWVAGEAGAGRDIAPMRAAPADLMGYLNLIHPSRLHVFGRAESDYYLHMEAPVGRRFSMTSLPADRQPSS